MSSVSVNSFIYCWKDKNFRKAAVRVFCCFGTDNMSTPGRNNVIQDGQNRSNSNIRNGGKVRKLNLSVSCCERKSNEPNHNEMDEERRESTPLHPLPPLSSTSNVFGHKQSNVSMVTESSLVVFSSNGSVERLVDPTTKTIINNDNNTDVGGNVNQMNVPNRVVMKQRKQFKLFSWANKFPIHYSTGVRTNSPITMALTTTTTTPIVLDNPCQINVEECNDTVDIDFEHRKRLNKNNNESSNQPKKPNSFWSHMKNIFAKDRIVQFLAQTGGGVLLYTAFIHMLPEIRENYDEYNKNRNVTMEEDDDHGSYESLPVVDIFACVGFFGIFLLEELMHSFFLKNHDHHHHGSSDESLKHSKSSHHHHHHHHHHGSLCRRMSVRQYMQTRKNYQPHVNEGDSNKMNQTSQCTNHDTGHINHIVLNETHPISTCQPSKYDSCEQTDMVIDSNGIVSKCDVENVSNFESIIDEDRTIFARIFDALLMILAFSCHAVFDGISIGVQSGSRIWTVLVAILSHKLLIAFILSVQIYERCFQTVRTSSSQPNAKPQLRPIKRAKPILWMFSTIFAAMSPIGILIVLAMDSTDGTSSEKQLYIIILAAISSGTIIYIVFLEIIDKSSSRTHISGIVQWIALLLGFVLMHIVSILFHTD
ncbi:hypothetical protein RDWZM_005351 [Blomia tropicalis]|uniref:Uncharacterized protein n=1 Tax=Blomia tropicalis TaxID=40697 RepID=A0A9Q0M642_BLOTA|nr:hypothetical protein RDWZM_005351 [Blomia tropicalis]